MALITRVTRLFQADLHAVLDRIEEPDVLLRQAVREMEDALARDEQRSKLLQHEHGQLISRQAEQNQLLGEIEEELDVCFAAGKDDLARTLIRRRLETQRLRKFLAGKAATLQTTLSGLQAQLEENRAQLDSMRQKAELLADDDSTGDRDADWNRPQITVREEDVEVAFLREKQQRSRA